MIAITRPPIESVAGHDSGWPVAFFHGPRVVTPFWIPIIALIGSLAASSLSAEPPSAEGIEFFENRIRPVLVRKCYSCHSEEAESRKGGLTLDTLQATRAGGDSGPAVVPGDVEHSLLIEAIRFDGLEMPPDGKLDDQVLKDFETWVAMGAPDPRDPAHAAASDQSAADRLWSLQPIQTPELPRVDRADWPANEIDYFVLNRLEQQGLEPVGDASRRALVRRVFFDLIGLPPTPAQVQAFLNDPASTEVALAELVDSLLASPSFGERWGRHWLDVARYAESTGKEWNWAHPQAWRYRDYVVESFNNDQPYDQFVREQIAGDLLPAEDHAQRDRQRVATGFLAIGPKAVSINNDEEFQLELADEQINTISRGLLGLTVGCARCHDHKFDPVPTEDYYALAGIFLSTQTLFGTSSTGFKGRNNKQGTALVPIGPEAEKRQRALEEHRQAVAEVQAKLDKQRKRLKQQTEAKAAKAKAAKAKKAKAAEGKVAKGDVEAEADAASEPGTSAASLRESIAELQRRLKALQANPPAPPEYAMGVQERANVVDCKVRIGGEKNQRGDSVPRGFLSAIEAMESSVSDRQASGRRELAEWIVDPANPLTARVMVNRVWQYLFGRGLVATVDNFGRLGEPPSHPELLDHLAASFVREGWSVKQLIRQMVTSRTYRLSTDDADEAAGVDPTNRWLWRMKPRRLEAEEIRDAILAVAGSLDRRPLPGSPAVAKLNPGWIGNEVKEPEFTRYDHRHRSLYLPIVRDQVPEMLQTFNFPNPAEVTGKRNVSVVPAQSLYLMNSPFVMEQAGKTAERVLEGCDAGRDEAAMRTALDALYWRVLSRPATAQERQRDADMLADVQRLLLEAGRDPQGARREAFATLAQSLISSGEFLFLY